MLVETVYQLGSELTKDSCKFGKLENWIQVMSDKIKLEDYKIQFNYQGCIRSKSQKEVFKV